MSPNLCDGADMLVLYIKYYVSQLRDMPISFLCLSALPYLSKVTFEVQKPYCNRPPFSYIYFTL